VIQQPYKTYLAEVMSYWAFWQVNQIPFLLDVKEHMHASAQIPDLPMHLSQKQEDTLMQHSYPYMMIEQFIARDAEALQATPPAQRYTFLDTQIQRGRGYGLEAHGDLQAYCAVALQYGEHFDEDAQVNTALARIKADQLPFDEAIALIPNSHWQLLQKQGALS
jgi:hypothetical protein